MALENLFAAEPELPNVQKTKLPENTDRWAEAITTQVREQFPDIAKNPVNIEFRKRNDQAGTAIGSIHVISLEAQKTVVIPVIIENFEMHPLDVYMDKKTQKAHPLTKDTFKQQFFTQNFSEGLDQRPTDSMGQYFNDPSMWTQTYPPLQGRYSYASAGYGVIDQISDTMTEEDLNTFKNELKANPMLLKKFAQNGHEEIIKKLAAKKSTVNTNDFGYSASKLIPTSLIEVKKEGYNKYSILSMTDGTFDLATSTKFNDRESCRKYLSNIIGKPEDFLNEVDQNGEKMAVLKPAPTKGVWLYDKQEKGPVNADQFTCYWVKNKNGLMIDALVIPKVVNFEGKPVKGKMVLSDTHSCFQDSVAGIEYKDSGCADKVLKNHNIRTGQTGVFVYVGENGKALSTIPVTVKAIESYGDVISVTDIYGKTYNVRRGWGSDFRKHDPNMEAQVASSSSEKQTTTLESLGFVELKKDYFVIPEKMIWVSMEPMTDVVSTPSEWLEKTAASKMEIDPVKMQYTGIVYEFSGHGLPKLAASERQAKMLLVQLGLPQEKVAGVMKKAQQLGKVTMHGCAELKSKDSFDKVAKQTVEKVAQACKNLKTVLVKEAAEIDDKATVDTLLSLGFLNPENLSKFVSYVGLLEACADKLADLTLASRLGLKSIPSSVTASAMSQLLEVIDGLNKIKSSMKKNLSKAA